MTGAFGGLLQMVWPFVAGLGCLTLNVFAKRVATSRPVVTLGGSWVSVQVKVSTTVLVRLFATTAGIALLVFPAFRDYSCLFPNRLRMHVYYDTEGISSALKQFSPGELDALGVSSDWVRPKEQYLAYLTKELKRKIIPESGFEFVGQSAGVHSEGETTFVVRRTEGWQEYEITESKGYIENYCEIPGKHKAQFRSAFELLDTSANIIHVTIIDIYTPSGWTKILRPAFKQQFQDSSGQVQYHHRLDAVTKIRFFPFRSVGNTIYLYTLHKTKQRIPIGYAVYSIE